jgi:hypothetical protein
MDCRLDCHRSSTGPYGMGEILQDRNYIGVVIGFDFTGSAIGSNVAVPFKLDPLECKGRLSTNIKLSGLTICLVQGQF